MTERKQAERKEEEEEEEEESFKSLWDNTRASTHVIRVPKGEENMGLKNLE